MSSIRVAADIKVYFNDLFEAFRSPPEISVYNQTQQQDSIRVMMHRLRLSIWKVCLFLQNESNSRLTMKLVSNPPPGRPNRLLALEINTYINIFSS